MNTIEAVCGRNPSNPPAGDSTSCDVADRLGLHRPGRRPTCTCSGGASRSCSIPGTPGQQTILNVPNYNFDYQRSYDLAHADRDPPGDKVQVTCNYNPKLGQKLPLLRKVPPALRHLGRRVVRRDVPRR